MPRCPNPRCQADYPPGSVQCTKPFCLCLLPEAVVAGRYRIETLIGLGGMGAVYRVSDTFEIEQVALKTLSLANSVMDVPTAVERFRREARYAHQLHHKNIVPILNFGQDGSLLYLVMPLITGGTLKTLMQAEHPLPTAQAQQYLNDLADAIDAVHAHPQQIVHRDIKPSNLLIHQDDGRLLLADFGIARAMQQEQVLTQRGMALGTEHYIAPEQEQGKAEPASDIYSMGVVAYQLFTGLLPFQALMKSRAADIPPPSTLNTWLPPAIDAVVLRAINIDPQKRYSSAHAFANALNDALKLVGSPSSMEETLITTSSPNVIVRTIIPENPCENCGRENRGGSRFCRYCGHSLDDTSPLVTDVCQVGYFSDIGRHAQANEDMLLVVQGLCINLMPPLRPFSLFAVADGLRGPQGRVVGGHEASRLAVETVADVLLPLLAMASHSPSFTTPGQNKAQRGGNNQPALATLPSHTLLEQWLREAVQQANRVIYHCNADYDTTMASTLVVALMYKRRLYVASVGDSRAYHHSARKGLQRITNDDTAAANQHYRYLGHSYQIPVDLFQRDVAPNDLILLCTDGIWHMVRDEHLRDILMRGGDLQQIAHDLVDAANDAGGAGNASAIVVRAQ